MSIGAMSADDINKIVNETKKSSNQFVTYNLKGLRASTAYSLYIDGINYSWLAKQFGKDLGEALVSDAAGNLSFGFLVETHYDSPYSYDKVSTTTDADASNGLQKPINNYVTSSKLIELRSALHTFSFPIKTRIIVTPGDSSTSSHHGH